MESVVLREKFHFPSIGGILAILIVSELGKIPFAYLFRTLFAPFFDPDLANFFAFKSSTYLLIFFAIFCCLYFYSLENERTITQNWRTMITPVLYFDTTTVRYSAILIPTVLVFMFFIVVAGNSFFAIIFSFFPVSHVPSIEPTMKRIEWFWIFSISFTPVLEELLFRGIIFQGFCTRYSMVRSTLASAILFGIWHLTPTQFISGCLLGIFNSWILYRTRSLWLCMIVHSMANLFLLSVIALVLQGSMATSTTISETNSEPFIQYPLWMLSLSLALTISGVYTLHRIFLPKRTQDKADEL